MPKYLHNVTLCVCHAIVWGTSHFDGVGSNPIAAINCRVNSIFKPQQAPLLNIYKMPKYLHNNVTLCVCHNQIHEIKLTKESRLSLMSDFIICDKDMLVVLDKFHAGFYVSNKVNFQNYFVNQNLWRWFVFEAGQKPCSTCFIGSNKLGYRLVF